MVAQNNTTLDEVYSSEENAMETRDTQVEAVTSWRERLQPKWNGKSARKNNKGDSIRQLESIGSDSGSSVNSDHAKQPAKNHYIFEDRDTMEHFDTKQPAKPKDFGSRGSSMSNIIIEGMDTIEFMEEGKSTKVDVTQVVTERDPPKTYTKANLDESKAFGGKSHSKVAKQVNFNGLNNLENVLFVKLNSTEEKIVEQAAQELASLVGGDKENCEKFYHFGGFGALLATMTRFPSSAKVQGTCITVFSNVAFHSILCRDALVTTSVLYVVTQAMQRFPRDALVQEMTLQFLWSFLDATGTKEKFVGELNGILLVTSAMAYFKEDVNIQKCGCQVLCKLSTPKGMKKQLKATNAVVCVASALYKYPNECQELADEFMTTVFPRPSLSKKAKRASVAFQEMREKATALKSSKNGSNSKSAMRLDDSSLNASS